MEVFKNIWKERYIKRLMDHYKFDREFAEDMFKAGEGDHDYSESPEDACDEEMSYWPD